MKFRTKRAFLIGPMLFAATKGGTRCSTRAARAALRKAFHGIKPEPGNASGDIFIAVDQGLEFCDRAKICVNLAVGDWDSLSRRELLKQVPQITLPRDKDRSDTYYALGAALLTGARSVHLAGFLGGRPDHELANYLEAASIALGNPGPSVEITLCSEKVDCAIVVSRRRFKLPRAQVVSMFGIGGAAEGVSLSGFRYSLKRARLEPSSRGLSNVTESEWVEVSVVRGAVLVIVPRGRFDKRRSRLA